MIFVYCKWICVYVCVRVCLSVFVDMCCMGVHLCICVERERFQDFGENVNNPTPLLETTAGSKGSLYAAWYH